MVDMPWKPTSNYIMIGDQSEIFFNHRQEKAIGILEEYNTSQICNGVIDLGNKVWIKIMLFWKERILIKNELLLEKKRKANVI